MEIIFCSGGNRRFAEVAREAGFLLGSKLPNTVYVPIYFADQDWRKPKREKYLEYLRMHKPFLATVLDWEREEQLPEVLSWSEDVAEIVEMVLIIPKVVGGVSRLPKQIGGKPVRLAFSYPTAFGSAPWSILDEMAGWPHGIHILGGQPQKQMKLLADGVNVKSVDGNYFQMKATRFCEYWTPNGWKSINHEVDHDAPLEAIRRSCANIFQAWNARRFGYLGGKKNG